MPLQTKLKEQGGEQRIEGEPFLFQFDVFESKKNMGSEFNEERYAS